MTIKVLRISNVCDAGVHCINITWGFPFFSFCGVLGVPPFKVKKPGGTLSMSHPGCLMTGSL